MNPVRNQHGETLDLTLHDATRQDHLVILGHGVTGNKDRPLLFWLAKAITKHGYPALRMSFSGNGNSEGAFTDCTITKEINDLTAVIDQLGHGKKITYIGHSMGAAVGALTAARDERIHALVSLAGMVFTKDFCKREFGELTPDQGFMWDEPDCPLSRAFVDDLHHIDNTLEAAKTVRAPWLLVHGTADDVVPPHDSRELLNVLPKNARLTEIQDATHSFENHHKEVAQAICPWLEKHLT